LSRRKHAKAPLAFATWELPELAARWCLREAGIEPGAAIASFIEKKAPVESPGSFEVKIEQVD
jgi:carbamoyltransferase